MKAVEGQPPERDGAMAARIRRRRYLVRLVYAAIFLLSVGLILTALLIEGEIPRPKAEEGEKAAPVTNSRHLGYSGVTRRCQVFPSSGFSSIQGQCVRMDGSFSIRNRDSNTSPEVVVIVAWSLTDYIRELLRTSTSADHVIVLCVWKCEPSRGIRTVNTDCDEKHLQNTLLPLNIGTLHYVYDADQHVTMAEMTSPVTGHLFHCSTAVMETLLKHGKTKLGIYFHFTDASSVRYPGSGVLDPGVNWQNYSRPCTIRFDHQDGHQLYVKLLEMVVRTFSNLYDFKYFYVVV